MLKSITVWLYRRFGGHYTWTLFKRDRFICIIEHKNFDGNIQVVLERNPTTGRLWRSLKEAKEWIERSR